MPFVTAKDYENLLSRYKQVATLLQQVHELMKQGVAQNVTHHKVSMVSEHRIYTTP